MDESRRIISERNSATAVTMDQNPEKSDARPQGPSLISRMALNDHKAGMEGLDKEKINQIIYNASKGSKFFENQRRKEEQLNEKIKEQQTLAQSISVEKLREGQHQSDLLLERMVKERDLDHTIVHVDMDAFYAAVEMRDNPDLKTKPMAVGGMGMLSTSNYLARKYGVRAAMPGFIGLKLCPELVLVKPDHEKYSAVSQEIRQVLAVYDPHFCPMSLDEAYLDFGPHLEYRIQSPLSARTFILRQPKKADTFIQSKEAEGECNCDLNCVLLCAYLDKFALSTTAGQDLENLVHTLGSENPPDGIPKVCSECQRRFPPYSLKSYGLSVEEAVLEMRNRIEQRTFLTASAGIAPNMMLAKICSDKNKPNGQFRILPDVYEIKEFMKDLPIRKISGIGTVSEKLLGGLNVTKCSDIFDQRALLYHLFSPTSFHYFLRIFLGIGSTTVQRDDERKSISTERTFSEISGKEELCKKCDEISASLAQDLKDENLKGKTVTLKIKLVSFEVKSRSHSLQSATNDLSAISATARQLLLTEIKNAQPAPLRLRLMGVRMSKLEPVEKIGVTVKDMFRRLATTSTSSPAMQEKCMKSETGNLNSLTGKFDNHNIACTSASATGIAVTSSDPDEKSSSESNFIIDKHKTTVSLTGHTQSKLALQEHCFLSSSKNCGSNSSTVEQNKMGIYSGSASQQQNLNDSLDFDSVENSGKVFLTCPVCGHSNSTWDLNLLNSHVDMCLSQQTIKELLHGDNRVSSNSATVSEASSQQMHKRTRSQTPSSQNADRPRKIQRTVISFFQK